MPELVNPVFDTLLRWTFLAGLFAIGAMGYDKLQAKLGGWRVPESALALIALLGGHWGILYGALLFHHKVSKPEFWTPIFISLILWLLAFAMAAHLI